MGKSRKPAIILCMASLTAVVPSPGEAAARQPWQPPQADVCAVAALADPHAPAPKPAANTAPSPAQLKAAVDEANRRDGIRYTDRWQGLGWHYEAGVLSGTWGRCRLASLPFNILSFSDDGRFAMTEWGSEPIPLGGEWGDCVFEKVAGRWHSLGCVPTAMS